MCSKPDSQLCGKCRSAAYCSVECQQTDWATHKLLCTQFSVLADLPGLNFKRAILFPEEGPNPVVFWMKFQNEFGCKTPQLKGIMGGAHVARVQNERNFLRGHDTGVVLQFYTYDSYLDSASMINRSILLVTKGKPSHPWMGPVVVLREQIGDTGLHEDITLTDFRNIVDFLKIYGLDPLMLITQNPPLEQKVKGVKVSCVGDIKRFSKKYVAVDVPKDHPVFFQRSSPISAMVGMTVKAHMYPFDKAWENMPSTGNGPWSNATAAFLHMEVDPNPGVTWGFAPMHWQNSNGNILVVREDEKDITPAEVEMLCDFCQYKMQPLFEDSNESGGGIRAKREVMAHVTPAGFRNYIDQDHRSDAINQLRERDAACDGTGLIPLELI